MANIDKVSVKNTVYNIVSPAVVSDYIEVIGGACTKPDGYEEDEVILAKQNDVQLLFKATQTIAFGANIVENTNCVRTTLEEVLKNAGGGGGASSADQVSYDNSDSGLEAENVQEAVDELATNAGTASSQIQTLTNKVNNMQGVNLLDNPWFTVNQRGFSTHTFSIAAQVFTADRWKAVANTGTGEIITLNNGVISVNNTNASDSLYLLQNHEQKDFENLNGKTVTVSALLADGTVKSNTFVYDESTTQYMLTTSTFIIMHHVKTSGEFFTINFYARTTSSIKAVKLELGSVSTLAMDTAPNYATELLKCQRYFQRLKSTTGNAVAIGVGYALATTDLRIEINYPGNMRVSPTVTASSPSDFVYTKTNYSEGSSPTAVSGYGGFGNGISIRLLGAESAYTQGDVYEVYVSANGYIDFSADL